MTWLDATGASLSLVATLLFIHTKLLAWPLSIIAITINFSLYTKAGLYGDSFLEILYLFLSLYGWYYWHGGKHRPEAVITHLGRHEGFWLTMFNLAFIPSFAYFLSTTLHSNIPHLDSLMTAVSLTAQWLMCRKLLETWLLWFIADALNATIYLTKDLPFHASLMAIYLLLAVLGYRQWQRQQHDQWLLSD